MGLDTVEILMKVEETFGINIPDEEAEKIITIKDFYNCVWNHLPNKQSNRCQTQALFYKLRKSFIETFKFSKQDFKPDTSLDVIFPQHNRRQAYMDFSNLNNLKFPDLVLRKPWAIFLNSFGMVTILGGLLLSIVLIDFIGYSKWFPLVPFSTCITLTYFISKLLNPMRTIIRPALIKEFILEVVSINYVILTKEGGVFRGEVEYIINHIIADLSGVELHEITPDKQIHNDLGID